MAIIAFAFQTNAQSLSAYNTESLQERISNKDTTYIVNFWATWCIPCVKELPEFSKLEEYYKDKPVKVLLVSLDFKESYPERLEKFISKKNLEPEVVWFSETNANEFIPKIERTWSGAIPATMVYREGVDKKFREATVTAEEIITVTDRILNK